MPSMGHYSGRLKEGVKKANEATRGRSGTFYSILNSAGFYDIDDEANKLTDWQRAGVPAYNQRRMSAFCTAISDMIADFLTNPDYGVMVPILDEIINKLDMRSTMNKGSSDAMSSAFSAIPGGQAVTAAAKTMEQLVAALMGGNPFDPDMLPSLTLGLPGLPLSIASCFKAGFFNGDWQFMYDHETVKSSKFYAGPDDTPYIGAGIPTTLGGKSNVLILKLIFSVPTVDENGNPVGDTVNGITADEFDLIIEASKHSMSEIENSSDSTMEKIRDFRLTDGQIRNSYYKYVQIMLWGVLCNSKNWGYLHWGCVTNNACPEPIKTATCSFIKTNGMALEPETGTEACLFSYLINTGMAYVTGKSKPVGLLAMPGMKYIASTDSKNVVTFTKQAIEDMGDSYWFIDNNGVPVDKNLANRFFMLAADLLSRMTYENNPDADALRRRRVDEANLIYQYCCGETITYGSNLIPSTLSKNGASKRGFFNLMNKQFFVYSNQNVNIPDDPGDIKIIDSAKSDEPLTDTSKNVIRYIARNAGLPGVVVTSLYRSPEKQASVMLENRMKANGQKTVSYAKPGQMVDAVYDRISIKYYGTVTKLKDNFVIEEARNAMTDLCKQLAHDGTPVSKHGADPTVIQAIDMGPKSMQAKFGYTEAQLKRFHIACYDAWKNNYIRAYFGPPEYGAKSKDPAFHIEVYQNGEGKAVPGINAGDVGLLPDQGCTVQNANLSNMATFDDVFVKDQIANGGNSGKMLP